jgi:hypothetical protein
MVENFSSRERPVVNVGDTMRILDCTSVRLLTSSGLNLSKYKVGDLAKVVEVDPRFVVLDDDWSYSYNSPINPDEVELVKDFASDEEEPIA